MTDWYVPFGTELLGAMILIILGNGVVANVLLKGNKASGTSFTLVALGWGFAVGVGAIVAIGLGGKAHLNPAVTFAFVVNNWTTNVGPWELLPIMLGGQVLGFLFGQIILDLVYSQQIKYYFSKTKEDFAKNTRQGVLGMHATVPQTRVVWSNFLMEFVGTAILVVALLSVIKTGPPFIFFGGFVATIAVLAIGFSLSGTTGYAINPLRDLIPRIIYQGLICMPAANKQEKADWQYAWIPVFAPLSAGVICGAFFLI